MPHPRHCVDCDKPATVVINDIYYCAGCALKEIEKDKEKTKNG